MRHKKPPPFEAVELSPPPLQEEQRQLILHLWWLDIQSVAGFYNRAYGDTTAFVIIILLPPPRNFVHQIRAIVLFTVELVSWNTNPLEMHCEQQQKQTKEAAFVSLWLRIEYSELVGGTSSSSSPAIKWFC